jgi:tripartite-type tricarboxylate transporter receptor subunit TctC
MKGHSAMRVVAALIIGCLGIFDAQAQPYPSKPLTIIVPFAAGGTTDAVARIVARFMSDDLGQPVLVENVGGAGGTIGTNRVVRATPDGYTLTFGHFGTLAANAILYPEMNYDPNRDITAIGVAVRNPMVLAVSNRTGVQDFKSFVELLRQRGDRVTFGTAGKGSQTDMASALFLHLLGLQATRVSYRGSGPAINDVVAGNVDAILEQTLGLMQLHLGGSLRALAVNTSERIDQMRDVPTFAEVGLPQFDAKVWQALAGPRGLDPAIVNRLAASLSAALETAEVRQRFTDLAGEIPPPNERGPQAMQALIASEIPRWTKVIREADNMLR